VESELIDVKLLWDTAPFIYGSGDAHAPVAGQRQ
jgi:hypothetical protein